MKLLKPPTIKELGFYAILLYAMGFYGVKLRDYCSSQMQIYKRQLAAKVIEEDLKGKDLTIDIKDKKSKTGDKLTTDDMKKALWVLNVQNEQLRYSLESVKSALDYHEGE